MGQEIVDCAMLKSETGGPRRIRLRYGEQVSDSIGLRRHQDVRVVIDEQGARGIERVLSIQALPEFEGLLRHVIVVCGHDIVHFIDDSAVCLLDPEAVPMSVGHQNDPLPAIAQRTHQCQRVGTPANQVNGLSMWRHYVQAGVSRPIVQTIEFDPTEHFAHVCGELEVCVFERESVGGGEVSGQQVAPDLVIELQVEQRAIHVEQHSIDLVPVDHVDPGGG